MSEPTPRFHLLVCDGPSCGVSYESERLVAHLAKLQEKEPALRDAAGVWSYSCFGLCEQGPNVYVCPAQKTRVLAGPKKPNAPWMAPGRLPSRADGGALYSNVDERLAEHILRQHCGEGRELDGLAQEL